MPAIEQNKVALIAEAEALIPDNTSNAVSPSDVRTILEDMIASSINILGEDAIKGLLKYNTDLSAGYDNRSIVDKEYIDNLVTTATGNYVPITGTDTGVPVTGNIEFFNGTGLSGSGNAIALSTSGILISSSSSVDLAATIKYSLLTASTVPYLDASKNLVSSAITPTEFGYISGATSNLQTQINALVSGLSWKQAVRVGTTANITLSGTQTIDGIAVIVGDRVLVKNQTAPAENGIYLCAAGAWTRTTDMDSSSEFPSATVAISEGATLQDTQYVCTNDLPITIGSTAILFVAVGGTTYTGTTNRITVVGSVIDISSAYVGQNTITTIGTIGTGVWNGTVIIGTYGGTGVNNSTRTMTYAGNVAFTGAFNATFAIPKTTTWTLPNTTNETLAGLGTAQTFSATQTFSSFIQGPNGSLTNPTFAFTNATNSGLLWDNSNTRLQLAVAGVARLAISATTLTLNSDLLFNDTNDITFNAATGTKIGTATNNKLGFWNVTPIVQPANTVAIDTVLINTGLRASGGSANFTLKITNNLPQNLKNYTVATLPAGVRGDIAYVTDGLTPAFLTAVIGGGAVVTPVFYDGTNWVSF